MRPRTEKFHAKLPIQPADHAEILEMYGRLSSKDKLVSPDGRSQNLPPSVEALLYQLLVGLSSGKSVSIVPSGAALTTVEAAKLLGVCQFLVNFLDAGELPFHKVGTHPRVYARDVFAYKQRRNVARRKALDDLVAAEVKEGLYDLGPDDSKSGH